MNAESSSHGQFVAHSKNMLRLSPELLAPSICLRSSVLILRVCSSSRELRCLHKLSISSMKTTCSTMTSNNIVEFLEVGISYMRCAYRALFLFLSVSKEFSNKSEIFKIIVPVLF